MYVDHDYAPEVMKRRKEYTEAKRVLREKKIRFQTPFPAKFRVFYEGETCLYNSAADATKDMVDRGFQVCIIKPAEDSMEKIQRQMWKTVQGASRRDQGVQGEVKDLLEGHGGDQLEEKSCLLPWLWQCTEYDSQV